MDGPPTIVGERLFVGCRDGHVYCLRATDGGLVWRLLAAPLERLTLSDDRLESVWPVSSSVLFQGGLVYAVAGRNSFLDGGIQIYALDPASGAVRHHRQLDGPWPTKEQLRTPVVTERELKNSEQDPVQQAAVLKAIQSQPATGYDIEGADADLLVADGTDLYMRQVKFTPALDQVPLQRVHRAGFRPMGGLHLMANYGLLDETMFHRSYWLYDEAWPGYSGGSGTAARAGTLLAVGENRVYAAKHYEGGWYPTHKPGSGNRLVCDSPDTKNMPGDQVPKETNRALRQYGNAADVLRTAAPLWETPVPIIVRGMLVAPDGQGGELVFSAGVVEGTMKAEWDESTNFRGPGRLLVHDGADGKQLAEYDLPACPVFDGLSAAAGRLILALVSGDLLSLDAR